VVDASYVDNPTNEGNIGLLLLNLTDEPVELKAGSRVAQGIFVNYLLAEGDVPIAAGRIGGLGSSGA
jgi:dUTP pyrophosphatase